MSHEGIRLVSEEQLLKENAAVRELPHDAKDPAKVRVLKTEGKGMEIDWKDGHKSAWTFAWLRYGCPCATCEEERSTTGRRIGDPPAKPASLLPMYEPPPRPGTVTPVGRYAIGFEWNDGHKSGIYSWEFLRRNCQCAECKIADCKAVATAK
jgi:DUF971 family protein